MKALSIVSVVVLTFFLASGAGAQMSGGGMMHSGGYGNQQGEGYQQNADGGRYSGQGMHGYGNRGWQSQWSRSLTPEQRKTVSRLSSEYGEVVAPIYAKLNSKLNDLYWALNDEKPERTRVMALAREVSEVRGELFEKQLEFRLTWIESGLPAESFGYGMMGSGMMGGGMMHGGMMGGGMMGGGMMW